MGTAFVFGSYIPGVSPIHRLSAQAKIFLACVFSVAVFLIDGWIGMLLICLLTVVLYSISGIAIRKAFVGLKPIIFILVFTILVHAIVLGAAASSSTGLGTLGLPQRWAFFGIFEFSLDGLLQGIFFALRIALLVAVCSLLTFTTSMVALTDGMLRILSPLRRFHAPVEDLSMMVSIALRFIPTTTEEANRIVQAQKARCADFDDGNLLRRMKAWIPVFIPLFVRLFRRADDLAIAMDARCYTGQGRTHAHEEVMHRYDAVAIVIVSVLLVALCVFL